MNDFLKNDCGVDDVVVYDDWMDTYREVQRLLHCDPQDFSFKIETVIQHCTDATEFKKYLEVWCEFNERFVHGATTDPDTLMVCPSRPSTFIEYFVDTMSFLDNWMCQNKHQLIGEKGLVRIPELLTVLKSIETCAEVSRSLVFYNAPRAPNGHGSLGCS